MTPTPSSSGSSTTRTTADIALLEVGIGEGPPVHMKFDFIREAVEPLDMYDLPEADLDRCIALMVTGNVDQELLYREQRIIRAFLDAGKLLVFSNPDVRTPFDGEEAMRLLDDLGFEDDDGDGFRETPDGEAMSLLIQTDGTDPTVVRTSELVVAQFAEVGVEAAVETVDPGTLPDLFSSREFDMFVRPISAHGVSDATQFAHSHTARYLGSYPDIPNPELDPLFEEWMEAETLETRYEALFEMQELLAREPTSLALYYPEENWAYRPEAYDDWIGTPAFGIVHKWSLLPEEARDEAEVAALNGGG